MIVSELVQREPWRVGQGRPFNALDPTWEGKEPPICNGEVAWERGGRWWFCQKCGYCSCWSQILHYRAEHPSVAYARNLKYFYQRRRQQGMSQEEAERQALHVMGAALKAAGMEHPSELGRFVDEKLRVW